MGIALLMDVAETAEELLEVVAASILIERTRVFYIVH